MDKSILFTVTETHHRKLGRLAIEKKSSRRQLAKHATLKMIGVDVPVEKVSQQKPSNQRRPRGN